MAEESKKGSINLTKIDNEKETTSDLPRVGGVASDFGVANKIKKDG